MRFRHLDYPEATPPQDLGPAALEALLDRGDLDAWRPLAAALRSDPHGELAERVLRILEARPLYGTAPLWRHWIEILRSPLPEPGLPARSLAQIRRRRGLTQQQVGERMGVSQSDVSKLERRPDMRLSTLRSYVQAAGGRLALSVRYPGDIDENEPVELVLERSDGEP